MKVDTIIEKDTWFDIVCDNCGHIHEVKAKSLKEAEIISESMVCCQDMAIIGE